MGIARFNGVQKVQGGSMPFESYLKQIHLLYPNVADMYVKYTTMINEFDSNQMGRLIGESEYEMASSLFDGKLNVFASLKENNLELFEAFLEAFGIREKIAEIFDLEQLTLEEMLELVRELYEEDYEAYLEAMEIIKNFEMEEFLRMMGSYQLTVEDIEENGEIYNSFMDMLLQRFEEFTDMFNVVTENGAVLSLLSEGQMESFNQRFTTLFFRLVLQQFDAYTEIPILDRTPSDIQFASWAVQNGGWSGSDFGSFFDEIIDKYEYEGLNYLDSINDTSIDSLFNIQNQYVGYIEKWMEMRIKMQHLDSRYERSWNTFETGINNIIDTFIQTIVRALEDDVEGFVFTDDFSRLIEYVVKQSNYQHINLLQQADKLSENHQRTVLETAANNIAQNIYAFSDYASSHGGTGADTFSSFFMQLAGHFQGYDQWGVIGSVMRSSDISLHAQFISANIARLIQGSDAATLNHMVGDYELQGFFNYLKTVSPYAYSGIKTMMDNAVDMNV